jgi:hypothetical protein
MTKSFMLKVSAAAVALVMTSGGGMADVIPKGAGFAPVYGYWQATGGDMLFVDSKHSFATGGPDCKFTHFVVHKDSTLPGKEVFDIDMMCMDEGPDAKPVRVHQTWALREDANQKPILVVTEKTSVIVYSKRDC